MLDFYNWKESFKGFLLMSGMPRPQVRKYDYEYLPVTRAYFTQGIKPEEACVKELGL